MSGAFWLVRARLFGHLLVAAMEAKFCHGPLPKGLTGATMNTIARHFCAGILKSADGDAQLATIIIAGSLEQPLLTETYYMEGEGVPGDLAFFTSEETVTTIRPFLPDGTPQLEDALLHAQIDEWEMQGDD